MVKNTHELNILPGFGGRFYRPYALASRLRAKLNCIHLMVLGAFSFGLTVLHSHPEIS
jgi:hypothetical protein